MKSLIVVCIISLLYSCKGQYVDQNTYLIKRLEHAENSKDIFEIKSIFSSDAILYTTDLMPVKGADGIISIFEFVFSRNDVESVEYDVDSTWNDGTRFYERGEISTIRTGGDERIQNFKVIFEKKDGDPRIIELSYGNEDKLKKDLPGMLAPTGSYSIGQRNFFFDRDHSGNSRLLSFQVWYPAIPEPENKQAFRSETVVNGISNFLGIPIFAISYFSEIESNTVLNARAINDRSFPVLIYNHGYGGFTQAYQSVFEDLASNGYVVVSLGHENESALLIKENGDIIANSAENSFYAERAPELNSSEIGRWQSLILNSNETEENELAYEEMLKLTPLHNESTRLWESDTRAAIRKLEVINNSDESLKGIFDMSRVGIFGHSLGGATAGQMCFGNTDIKAGINLDGFQFGDLYQNNLEVPFMFVSSNQEGTRYLRALTFMENANDDCFQVSIRGFTHDSFTDMKFLLEGDKTAMELQRALVRNFFDKYLLSKDIDLKQLEEEFEQLSIFSPR